MHVCRSYTVLIHGAFQAQDSFGGEATPSYEWRKRAETKMLELLETGRRQLFWTAWEKYVPASIRETDPNLARLEVDLHVYFVVAALSLPKARSSADGPLVAPFDHNGGVEAERGSGGARGDQREAIDALKIHLDGRGRALVETGECAHFCALAVLARPWDGAQLKGAIENASVPIALCLDVCVCVCVCARARVCVCRLMEGQTKTVCLLTLSSLHRHFCPNVGHRCSKQSRTGALTDPAPPTPPKVGGTGIRRTWRAGWGWREGK